MKSKNQLEIAFEMGMKAFRVNNQDSPYKQGTVLHKEWQRGYDRGYFECLDRNKANGL